MRLQAGARLCLVLLLALAAAGCRLSPPEWAYFDIERHPVGAIPANAGFYAGAYVVGPVLVFMIVAITNLDGNVDTTSATWDGVRGFCCGTGIGVGAVLGAPFHLLGLPFRCGDDVVTVPAKTPAGEEPGPPEPTH